jgi:hypothetical protein
MSAETGRGYLWVEKRWDMGKRFLLLKMQTPMFAPHPYALFAVFSPHGKPAVILLKHWHSLANHQGFRVLCRAKSR